MRGGGWYTYVGTLFHVVENFHVHQNVCVGRWTPLPMSAMTTNANVLIDGQFIPFSPRSDMWSVICHRELAGMREGPVTVCLALFAHRAFLSNLTRGVLAATTCCTTGLGLRDPIW